MMVWTRDIMLHPAMNVLSIINIEKMTEKKKKRHESYLKGI